MKKQPEAHFREKARRSLLANDAQRGDSSRYFLPLGGYSSRVQAQHYFLIILAAFFRVQGNT